jgi:hypothetical protein
MSTTIKAEILEALSKLSAEAAQWYNPRQPGLGEKFIREVDRAIASILENPLAFSVHSLPP